MAPPSARQLAPPRRSKFSSPLSPSMSVTQPVSDDMVLQPTKVNAATISAATMLDRRFMGIPPQGYQSCTGMQRNQLFLVALPGARFLRLHLDAVFDRSDALGVFRDRGGLVAFRLAPGGAA